MFVVLLASELFAEEVMKVTVSLQLLKTTKTQSMNKSEMYCGMVEKYFRGKSAFEMFLLKKKLRMASSYL